MAAAMDLEQAVFGDSTESQLPAEILAMDSEGIKTRNRLIDNEVRTDACRDCALSRCRDSEHSLVMQCALSSTQPAACAPCTLCRACFCLAVKHTMQVCVLQADAERLHLELGSRRASLNNGSREPLSHAGVHCRCACSRRRRTG